MVLTCCKEGCQGSRSGLKGIAGSGHQGNSLDSSSSRRLPSTENKTEKKSAEALKRCTEWKQYT